MGKRQEALPAKVARNSYVKYETDGSYQFRKLGIILSKRWAGQTPIPIKAERKQVWQTLGIQRTP